MTIRSVIRPVIRDVIRPVIGGLQQETDPILALFAGGEAGDFFDLSNHATTFQDSVGLLPATADNDPLGRIVGLANGNALTQVDITKRPILRTDGTLWWMEMDGVDDQVAGSLNFNLKPNTYIAVAYERNNEDTNAIINILQAASSSADYFRIVRQSNFRVRSSVSAISLGIIDVPILAAFNTSPANTPIVIESWVESQPGDFVLSINGTQFQTASPWPNSVTLGNVTYKVETQAYKWYGSVILNRVPTAAERLAVRTRLAALAGVTLP